MHSYTLYTHRTPVQCLLFILGTTHIASRIRLLFRLKHQSGKVPFCPIQLVVDTWTTTSIYCDYWRKFALLLEWINLQITSIFLKIFSEFPNTIPFASNHRIHTCHFRVHFSQYALHVNTLAMEKLVWESLENPFAFLLWGSQAPATRCMHNANIQALNLWPALRRCCSVCALTSSWPNQFFLAAPWLALCSVGLHEMFSYCALAGWSGRVIHFARAALGGRRKIGKIPTLDSRVRVKHFRVPLNSNFTECRSVWACEHKKYFPHWIRAEQEFNKTQHVYNTYWRTSDPPPSRHTPATRCVSVAETLPYRIKWIEWNTINGNIYIWKNVLYIRWSVRWFSSTVSHSSARALLLFIYWSGSLILAQCPGPRTHRHPIPFICQFICLFIASCVHYTHIHWVCVPYLESFISRIDLCILNWRKSRANNVYGTCLLLGEIGVSPLQ